MEIYYRDCQRFATDEIGKGVAEVNLEFVRSETLQSKDRLRSRVGARFRGLAPENVSLVHGDSLLVRPLADSRLISIDR